MNPLTILSRKEKENNREFAYRILRFNIMSLALPPGATLNENELAEQLCVSRTPVHEALTSLKAEYLVDILPQSGSFVSYILLGNVQEGLFLRSTIEPAIYRQLCGNAPLEYLQLMEENLKETYGIAENTSNDYTDDLIRLDDNFHKLAYLAAQKPILWKSMRMVCSHFQRIRYLGSLLMKQDLSCIHQEHQMLYDYLLLGGLPDFDIDVFYCNHLSYFKSYFTKLTKEHPQYFKYK